MLLDRIEADNRATLDPMQPDYWATRIEPGRFVMGPSKQREDDAFTATIRQPYALAHFPVTNRLYQRYIDALEQQGEEEELRQRLPGNWRGRRFTPGKGNQPVTNVSWPDATAFAVWFDAHLRQRGVLAAGEQIRLPLETEWERAAAYPAATAQHAQRRNYPWGALAAPTASTDALLAQMLDAENDAATTPAGPANTEETGLNKASVVGLFPDGAADCGAEDMAGNVWEWCASVYQPYPLPDDLAPWDGQSRHSLVLRGGSFYSSLTIARCGARGDSRHGNNHSDGFRLVRSFSA